MCFWFWYLYGPSVGQPSGQSSLVWFCRMFTISCLTDWISFSAPGQADRQTGRGETGVWDRQDQETRVWLSVTFVSRPSLCLCTVSVEILRRDAGQRRLRSDWRSEVKVQRTCREATHLERRVESDAKLIADVTVLLLSAVQHCHANDLLPV